MLMMDAGVEGEPDAAAAQPMDADDDADEVEEILDDRPQRVIDGLFIGSAWAEMNMAALNKAGITDILQVAQGLFPHHPLSFTYMVLQVEDAPSTDLVRHFPRCFEFCDAAIANGGSVLVHCAAGVSRSATIVLGYLMSRRNLDLASALGLLKSVRPWVCPNEGFLQQLAAYQQARCSLTGWRPWHHVWAEQHGGAQQQAAHAQAQQQRQCWLSLPQPGAAGGRGAQQVQWQQQQQQQRQQPGSDAAAPDTSCGGADQTAAAAAPAAAPDPEAAAPAAGGGCSSSSSRDGGPPSSSVGSRVRFAASTSPPTWTGSSNGNGAAGGSNGSGNGSASGGRSRAKLSRNYSFGSSLTTNGPCPPDSP